MDIKKVKLKVKQKDLLEKKESVIFFGNAEIKSLDGHQIFYEEEDKTKVELMINKKHGYLKRKGEVLTEINFKLADTDQCIVSTDVGDIFMDTKTLEINLEKDNVFLYYELLEAGAVVGRFQLRLEWENE